MDQAKIDQAAHEKAEILKRYRQLLKACKSTLEKGDKELIRKAFDMALEAHKDMRRKSGEPYIYHPLAVAKIAAEEIGLGTTSVVCALLHDVVEDTYITLPTIKKQFGAKVASIIDGLTKISASVFNEQTNSLQAENFRKMLLTLGDDVRVIILKLADRLHNMRTLESMSRNTQLKIASETLYIYAPLAHRLGLYAMKTELEDLSIKFTESNQYKLVAAKLSETKQERNRFIKKFIEDLDHKLQTLGLKYEIIGRPKSIFSIMKKMQKQQIPFEEVYDLFAIRIIVDSPLEREKADCFQIYGLLTDNYTLNPARYRDWITHPKSNGYESLHTTVLSHDGKWVEVQIRTSRMDDIAEKGYAAHWKYKEAGVKTDSGLEDWLAKVRETLENPEASALDFIDDFQLNFMGEEVFVFTPKGSLKKLSQNATALDFAFDIHSDVGNHCIGAKVNNKLVPLSYKLQNGDTIEILTSQKQKPNEDWLNFVVTGKARSRIKYYLKEEIHKVAEEGEESIKRRFRNSGIEMTHDDIEKLVKHFDLKSSLDFFYLVGKGSIDKTTLNLKETLAEKPRQTTDNKSQDKAREIALKAKQKDLVRPDTIIIGDDDTDLDYSLSTCCAPIPGDDIFAFVTVGDGIKIHRTNCKNSPKMMSTYGYRVLKARWSKGGAVSEKSFLTNISIVGTDSVGIVQGITDIISKQMQVNMKSISIDTVDGRFEGSISLYIYDTNHLDDIIQKISEVDGIYQVIRNS
ncbi:MAG: RelA/SpoT family protein [Bacteroidota bacterium]|nr:RelA/SpoT family protein [Bacteroidota bacterium]